jgi:hypothetical protein
MNLDKMSASPAPSGRDFCEKWQNTVSITHPYGATGTFVLKDTEHRHVYASQVRRYETCMSDEPPGGGGNFYFKAPEVTNTAAETKAPENGLLNAVWMLLDDDVTMSTM